MKKKGLVITLSIIGATVLLIVIGIGVIFISGNQITVARCIISDNGSIYMVYSDSPVKLNYGKNSGYQTGDKLLIVHQSVFAESYPEQTRAYFVLKIGSGTDKDIPQKAFDVLIETGNLLGVMPEDTALEFWITDNVEKFDFTDHDEIPGWVGAREYLGSGYQKIADSEGTYSKPNYYVSYLVTAYPDYADGGEFVTRIVITDPEIRVYGLTVDSTVEDFNSVFESLGFALSDGESTTCLVRVAEKNGITFTFTKGKDEYMNIVSKLVIQAEVTNRDGIVY